MKQKKIWSAINKIDDILISEAEKYEFPENRLPHGWKIAAVAACLVLSIVATAVFWPKGNPYLGNLYIDAFSISAAEYPEAPKYPIEEDYATDEEYIEAYELWAEFKRERNSAYSADYSSLQNFTSKTTAQFLGGRQDENPVYSPISLYLALGMLAEITDKSSQDQILSLLGETDLQNLRQTAKAIWNRNYINDGSAKTILASSLWLNKDINFNRTPINSLSKNYYSDVFSGNMADPEYSSSFQWWLNQQTEGMLKEQISGLWFDPQTILALATTIYFEAKWADKFREDDTYEEAFHTATQDIKCDFLHDTNMSAYYWGDKFTAAKRDFQNSGSITFILPDKGYSPDDLLEDAQVANLIAGNYENEKLALVNYAIPKFDIASTTQLIDGLKELGIKDVFGLKADFSPLTDSPAFIGKAEQSARVAIDENGCKAAAYTVMLSYGAGIPDDKADLILNRPFLFVINGEDDAPLFIGIVNNPVE